LQINVNYGSVHHFELTNLVVNQTKTQIYAIIPLSGRTNTFDNFISNWIQLGLVRQFHLTFSVMDTNETSNSILAEKLNRLQSKYPESLDFKIVKKPFSRGVALQTAIELRQPNDLLFLCDIDMVIGSGLQQNVYFLVSGTHQFDLFCTSTIFISSAFLVKLYFDQNCRSTCTSRPLRSPDLKVEVQRSKYRKGRRYENGRSREKVELMYPKTDVPEKSLQSSQ